MSEGTQMRQITRIYEDGVLVQEDIEEFTEGEYLKMLEMQQANKNTVTLAEINSNLILPAQN